MSDIIQRKDDHISLACDGESTSFVSSGFDDYRFEHNALPEINFSEIDISTDFLGRKLNLPLIISPITGGDKKCEKINRNLAGIANDFGIGLSVGSQRIAIENNSLENSFKIRSYAPNILLFANLGAVQLNYGCSLEQCKRAVEMIEADALILHLNSMQEIFQIDGNTNFSGLLKKIEKVCSSLNYPVIIKEIGYGISAFVAEKLQNAGVYGLDIAGAGAGSVSWSILEGRRSSDIVVHNASKAFADWGNPTVDCLRSISANLNKVKVIASGGIRTGVDIAKAMAFGADICGNAVTFLQKITLSYADCENFVESVILELKAAMFGVGSKNIDELKSATLLRIK